MPILDITIVGEHGGDGLAARLADAAGDIFGTPPGRTWVRLHRLPAGDYAENGVTDPPHPVFVRVILAEPPGSRATLAAALAQGLSEPLGRSPAHVHVLFEPPAAGRIAFGGALVPAPEPARATSGAPWEAIVGYSRAVRIGDLVWVTGTTGLSPEGAPTAEEDAYAQARQTFDNIERALGQLGAGMHHVVRTRMFVVDIERDWQAVGRAHAERFGEIRPATTMVEVRRLIEPWMRVEIEADAFVR